MVAREERKVVTPGRLKVTRELLKFCSDHAMPDPYLSELKACLSALEQKDMGRVSQQVQFLSHAGMGSFLDWVPTATFEHEDAEYVDTIWQALLGHWLAIMRVFRPTEV